MNRASSRKSSGFTIVELLVVIVVIGILAAITIVAYTGISGKATVASLTSDLDNSSKQLKMYYVDHGSYPTSLDGSNCPLGSAPSPDTKYCLKSSSGNSYIGYSANNQTSPNTFILIASNSTTSSPSSLVYKITDNASPVQLAQTMQPGVTPGAVLELHAAKANNGTGPGINSPLTTTWKDTSGNGNNGTLTGFGGQTPWAGAGTPSDPHRLVSAGGAYGFVSMPDLSACEGGAWTYEAWVNTTSVAGTAYVTTELTSGGSPVTSLYISAVGTVVIGQWSAEWIGYAGISGVGPAVNDGDWHHVVATGNATTLELYVDGVTQRVGGNVAQLAMTGINTANFLGGVFGPFPGSSALARIYPFALTPGQVAQNYAAGPDW